MKYDIGDIVTHTEDGGEYEVMGTKGKSRTIYECKDVTPDDEYREWHQRKGGGAYTTKFVNGFFGEVFFFHNISYLRETYSPRIYFPGHVGLLFNLT